MPEHRDGTPEPLRDLESFLWWDFDNSDLWRTWAERRGWQASAGSFERILGVQRSLREMQRANNGMDRVPAATDVLNQAILDLGLRPLVSGDGSVILLPAASADALGRVLSLAVTAMQQGLWKRFKICRDEVCRASYFDATKNGTKTWCSMETCGGRNKMRRFRAKNT